MYLDTVALTGQHVNQTHEDTFHCQRGAKWDQRHVVEGAVHHLNNACACVAHAIMSSDTPERNSVDLSSPFLGRDESLQYVASP